MKPDKWPIRPVHITSDGERYKDGEEAKRDLSRLTGVGIIPNDYLQGLQTAIANTLGNPTTIIEFPVDPSGYPVRTDSIAIHFDLHPPCGTFRKKPCEGKFCGDKFCKDCDQSFASLFRGLTRQNVAMEFRRRLEQLQAHGELALHPGSVCTFRDEDPLRPYLEYDCPLLGYRELIFPILFEDRIIAVFFLGQIVLRDRLNFIKETQAAFFKSHPAPTRQQEVAKAHQEWVNDPNKKNIYDDDLYCRQVDLAKTLLNKLDGQLQKEVALQRERFLQGKVGEYVTEFRKQLQDNIKAISADVDACWRRENVLEPLWRALETVLRQAVDELALRFVTVFGSDTATDYTDGLLQEVVHAGLYPVGLIKDNCELSFNLDRLNNPELRNTATTSDKHPELFCGLMNHEADKESTFLRLVPGAFLPQSTIVVFMGYDHSKWDPRLEKGATQQQGVLPGALDSFYAVVTSSLASIIALTARTRMKDTMRVLGHEARQVTTGLDTLRVLYLLDPAQLKALEEDKARDFCCDVGGFLKQINFIFRGAGMLVSAMPLPIRTHFLAYKELLFKWKDTYRTECEAKCLQFHIEKLRSDDPLRPSVYGDVTQLEQLLYNLVGNAVKYCHRGTKIYVDCSKRDTEPTSAHVLTVRNYGRAVETGEKPYELYYRGANAQQEDGLGIGLYNARRSALNHGGRIWHKCDAEPISEYNIPLIEAYLSREFPGKDHQLADNLKAEYQMLQESGMLNVVLARNEDGRIKYSEPSDNELTNAITQPTYEVTFFVTIPAKEEDRK